MRVKFILFNKIYDNTKSHDFSQTSNLSLLILILSIHDFFCFHIHHYPRSSGKIRRRIIKIENFSHGFKIIWEWRVIIWIVYIFFLQVVNILLVDPFLWYLVIATCVGPIVIRVKSILTRVVVLIVCCLISVLIMILFEIIPLTDWSCAALLHNVALMTVIYGIKTHFVAFL